ncbi:hypothetical protein GCM10023191_098300 [Actinoallomurus oryzae]|uniref:Transposase n=1 Tax=Actinoallomurus oryzae TaxID=502180 RepID=A0ABP8R8K4_9ACTN
MAGVFGKRIYVLLFIEHATRAVAVEHGQACSRRRDEDVQRIGEGQIGGDGWR